MYITLDIGNTNIVAGIFDDKNELINKYRFNSDNSLTIDDYGMKFLQLLTLNSLSKKDINAMIVGSVVPELDLKINEMSKKYLNIEPIFVGPGIKSGINIKIDNPKQLGADLLVGAVGAIEKYGGPVLVIDIGTAMTFSYINQKKEFLGGSIMPGIKTAFSSLISKTSKLESVGLEDTNEILGRDTKTCLQSGMIFGWTSIIEGMIYKFKLKFGDFKVVITGGEARFVIDHINKDINIIYDDELLLDGLKQLYLKNK